MHRGARDFMVLTQFFQLCGGGVHCTVNPATREAEAGDLCEFKANLVYRMSSRTGRAVTP